jgi:hypothetical protein
MGKSSDLGYATLNSMSNNFIRLETLKEANDKVSKATAGLAIFHHYEKGFVQNIHSFLIRSSTSDC